MREPSTVTALNDTVLPFATPFTGTFSTVLAGTCRRNSSVAATDVHVDVDRLAEVVGQLHGRRAQGVGDRGRRAHFYLAWTAGGRDGETGDERDGDDGGSVWEIMTAVLDRGGRCCWRMDVVQDTCEVQLG